MTQLQFKDVYIKCDSIEQIKYLAKMAKSEGLNVKYITDRDDLPHPYFGYWKHKKCYTNLYLVNTDKIVSYAEFMASREPEAEQSKRNTVRWWLNRIADKEIREAAIHNLKRKYANMIERNLAGAIIGGFSWGYTKEGGTYWRSVWKEAKNNRLELLPETEGSGQPDCYWAAKVPNTGTNIYEALAPAVFGVPTDQVPNNEPVTETPATAKTILQEAQDLVFGQREKDYGSATENFTNIAKGWTVIAGTDINAEQVALMMAWLKICRANTGIKTAGTSHRDSILDLAGYAGCIEKIQNKE